jgi:hypothetical protein
MVFSFVEKGWIDLKPGMFADMPDDFKDASSIEVEFTEAEDGNTVLAERDGQAIIRKFQHGNKAMYVVKEATYDMRTGSAYRKRMDPIWKAQLSA